MFSPDGYEKSVLRGKATVSRRVFRPVGAGQFPNSYPRLAPWAAFLCRFAALWAIGSAELCSDTNSGVRSVPRAGASGLRGHRGLNFVIFC